MTRSRKAEAAEALTKKAEGRPAQTARAQARAAKAQAKARQQRLKELEKKVAKQEQAWSASSCYRAHRSKSVRPKLEDLKRWRDNAKSNRNKKRADLTARAKENETVGAPECKTQNAARRAAKAPRRARL